MRYGVAHIESYSDWFMPSLDELSAMFTNIVQASNYTVGNFSINTYISSTEYTANFVSGISFGTGNELLSIGKTAVREIRPCRRFTTAAGAYELLDRGPAGGWIFYISGTTYYEAYTEDIERTFSSITNVAIGTTGSAVGTGIANTAAIITQSSDSAAAECAAVKVNIPKYQIAYTPSYYNVVIN